MAAKYIPSNEIKKPLILYECFRYLYSFLLHLFSIISRDGNRNTKNRWTTNLYRYRHRRSC
jgi:hypothetical protein